MAYRVLLVDDSEVTRRMIHKTLRLGGVPVDSVFEVSNGVEALALLEREWIDVVFIDLNMPVMDGFELIERMSADGVLGTIPVIVVSTEGGDQRVASLIDKGVSAFVRKPFAPEEIRVVVDRLLLGEVSSGAELTPLVTDQLPDDRIESLLEIVEGYLMMMSEPVDPVEIPVPDQAIRAEVHLRGDESGAVTVMTRREDARRFASTVLGQSEGEHSDEGRELDVVGELANVIAGRLGPGDQANPSSLHGPPVLSIASPEAWVDFAGAEGCVGLDIEGCGVLVGIFTEG